MAAQKNIFEIRKAHCSYTNDERDSVLFIDYLDIPAGEVVFLLGSSGAGKSTLLETLGLMNKTLVSGEIVFKPGNEVISYKKLWGENSPEALSKTRRSFLSFIFQNTNLMDNFTAYENICLSAMIKKGESQSEAMEGAKKLMERLGMPISQVSENTLASNLSGGQKQRVAFVRALNSGFSVLFGDEPTGNLDENNANELINIIKENIHSDYAAIIVSHDIDLALKHASRIICLSKSKQHRYAEVLPHNIFVRSEWETLNSEKLYHYKEKIRSLYDSSIDKKVGDVQDNIADVKIKHKELFLLKEGRSLIGKGYSNLLALIAIFSLTLLSIGFANGSLDYLDKVLNDPFVNWLTLTIPNSRNDEIPEIKSMLNLDDIKTKYGIKNVVAYSAHPVIIRDNSDTSAYNSAKGRSIALDERIGIDPLVQDIMKDENRIEGSQQGFRSSKDLSVIVTEKFLKQYNYDTKTPYIVIGNPVRDTITGRWKNFPVPIGVRGVVKDLPGKVDLIYSEYFLRNYNQNENCIFDTWNRRDIKLVIKGEKELADSVYSAIQDFFNNNNQFSGNNPLPTSVAENNNSYHKYFEIIIDFSPIPLKSDTVELVYSNLINSKEMIKYKDKIMRAYRLDLGGLDYSGGMNYDILSVNFKSLDEVRNFSEFISNKYNDDDMRKSGNIFEVDIASVRSKENFLFLSNIAKVISNLVLIFGVLSIIMFISNLLKTHLAKIRMNIGTFKAFGLADTEAQGIYFLIILKFIFTGLFISFIFSFGAGYFFSAVLKEFITVEEGLSFFKLIDPFTFISIFIIIASGIIVSWFTINKMLNKSPGDLIFNRN